MKWIYIYIGFKVSFTCCLAVQTKALLFSFAVTASFLATAGSCFQQKKPTENYLLDTKWKTETVSNKLGNKVEHLVA